ncbi:MAG: transporter substrate-binding domain-containing protein [Chloroflexaceae bacterium]|nr:transporter substrate-binding domain-containing protein [Chloroflexaceae bacterium]
MMAYPRNFRSLTSIFISLAALVALALLLTACDIPFLGRGAEDRSGEETPAPSAPAASPIAASGEITGTRTTAEDEPEPTVMLSPSPETSITPASEASPLPASTPAPTRTLSTTSLSGTLSTPAPADLAGQTLVVGSYPAYPPMEYVDSETKRIVGFDLDLMYEIGALLNATVEFRSSRDFDRILEELNQGEFDLVVSGVAVTTERMQVVDFSRPYLEVGQVVVVSAEQPGIAGVADLPSARLVGVQQGTIGEEVAQQAGLDATRIQRYETVDLAFNALVSGGVEAVVADGPVAAWYVSQHRDLIRIAGEPFRTAQYAIALQQGNTALKDAVDRAIQELEANGTLPQLLARWQLTEVATIP